MADAEPSWIVAKRGISLLLNDKNEEAEKLFTSNPQSIHMTAGICYVTFMNALLSFDDTKVSEAIVSIKKIEEQCATHIGWVKSFRNRIFTDPEDGKTLEQILEEKIVLADSLVCQAFLTFLHNDLASYMKGGWTLRRAWKVYQHTYDQLLALHKTIFGQNVSGLSSTQTSMADSSPSLISSPSWSPTENEPPSQAFCTKITINNNSKFKFNPDNITASKTFSDFSNPTNDKSESNMAQEEDEIDGCESEEGVSDTVQKSPRPALRPDSLNLSFSHNKKSKSANGFVHHSSMRKSVSLFSSLNSFSSAILESATSLIGFNKPRPADDDNITPAAVERLLSGVCFGYGIFRLCVSLAPPGILRWASMLGFEGDQASAINILNHSRKGSDMRAPLASLALLWYHTIVRPFFNLDGVIMASGAEEANKILQEEQQYKNSALFLFFRGRVERLKPNIPAAIDAYRLSVSHASIPDVKLLGLHEVGWCHMLTLDYQSAAECFIQLRHRSKWSRSFYAYLSTITVGATGNHSLVLAAKAEIRQLLDKSSNKGAQIEKYIRRRMEKLPEKKDSDEEWVQDRVHWQLYCFEMLYLWNTFPSCSSRDLKDIVQICTPPDDYQCLANEPMYGLGWLIRGAACLVLGNRQPNGRLTQISASPNHNHSDGDDNANVGEESSAMEEIQGSWSYLENAVHAFRTCLKVRSKCSDDVHVSAFAQYELALLLLRNEETRPEGKLLLVRAQSQYKDYDFEHRLNVRINTTLRSVEKFESQQKNK